MISTIGFMGGGQLGQMETREEPFQRQGLDKVLAMDGVYVHYYGKDPQPRRKIGHFTALADSVEVAMLRAGAARRELTV